MVQQQLSTNTFCEAKWVVNPTLGKGTHTTITAALTSASSGDTIFICPGTFTENLSLKAGVNLSAYGCDGSASNQGANVTPNVIIKGTASASFTGVAAFSGIQFLTNGAAAIALTGANVGQLIFNNCSINANDGTGFTMNAATYALSFLGCVFNSASTNILFAITTGGVVFQNCIIALSSSAGASTIAVNTISFNSCAISGLKITTTTTGSINVNNCNWIFAANTLLTMAGTGMSTLNNSEFESTSASTFSIGTGCTLNTGNCIVNSSNTNAITGAGTFSSGPVNYSGSSFTNNVTTKAYTAFGETGTFTPTLVGSTVAGTTTYTNQQGYFTRIGNLVHAQVYISITAATGTGVVLLGGLPFTIKNQTNGYVIGAMFWQGGATWTWPTGATSISFLGALNTTGGNPWVAGTAIAGGFVSMANAALTLSYTITYQA
jgi:hypothetical protein